MITWTKNVSRTAVAALALAGLMSTAASAATIDFNQANGISPAGSISYGGFGGPATGASILFDNISLTGSNAPSGHQNNLYCQGCALNFDTGFNISNGPDTWTFDSLGSSFMLTGDAYEQDAQGNPTGSAIAQGALVTGAFTGTPKAVAGSAGMNLTFQGHGFDQKPFSLLSYFGFDSDANYHFSTTLTSQDASIDEFGGFSGSISSARVSNAVPEPSELGLFGLGLALIAGLASRRRKSGAHTANLD